MDLTYAIRVPSGEKAGSVAPANAGSIVAQSTRVPSATATSVTPRSRSVRRLARLTASHRPSRDQDAPFTGPSHSEIRRSGPPIDEIRQRVARSEAMCHMAIDLPSGDQAG